MTTTLDHLHRLYADSDDPWHFATSRYEQAKFAATRAALPRPRYRSALEIGCGNGALAQHLAPLCDTYIGMDAVARAVALARQRVPKAQFVHAAYPCDLPGRDLDLIVLSEVLYFLTPAQIGQLAGDLIAAAPGADVICVTYLGDTAQEVQGEDTLAILATAAAGRLALQPVVRADGYRIDCGTITAGPAA